MSCINTYSIKNRIICKTSTIDVKVGTVKCKYPHLVIIRRSYVVDMNVIGISKQQTNAPIPCNDRMHLDEMRIHYYNSLL